METLSTQDEPVRSPEIFDRAGIWLSGLCIVHCVAMPFLIALFPALELLPGETAVHATLAALVLLVTIVAFYRGYLIHGNVDSLVAATVGVFLLFIAMLVHEHVTIGILSGEAALTTIGGALLIMAHTWNFKACRSQNHSH